MTPVALSPSAAPSATCCGRPPAAPAPHHQAPDAWDGVADVPQYRLMIPQGCLCTTGAACGGCCPGAVSRAMAQSCHAAKLGGSGALAWANGVLGPYGLYSSAVALKNSSAAYVNLQAVRLAHRPALRRQADWLEQLAAPPFAYDRRLAAPRAAAAAQWRALAELDGVLQQSIDEQRFNWAVVGVLQGLAAATTTWAALGHVLGWLPGGGAVTTVGMLLFALYAGCLAVKLGSDAVAFAPPSTAPEAPPADEVAAATAQYLRAARRTQLHTAVAWSAIAACAVVGLGLSVAAVTAPAAWAAQAGATLLCAGLAMWRSRETRYSPHLPLAPHLDREVLVDGAARAAFFAQLSRQHAAVRQAGAALRQPGGRWVRLQQGVEAAWAPQCGPRANRVTAATVGAAHRSGATAVWQQQCLVVAAARTLCDAEQQIAAEHAAARRATLQACATAPPADLPAALQRRLDDQQVEQRSRLQEAEARGASLATTLRQLDDLYRDLLANQMALSAARLADWRRLQVVLLQSFGALGEAVPAAIVRRPAVQACLQRQREPRLSPRVPDYPLDCLQVRADKLSTFIEQFGVDIDAAFVQTLLNPRRFEVELDHLMELQRHGNWQAAASGRGETPHCRAESCCK